MPDFQITSDSGEQFTIGGQATKPDQDPPEPKPWPGYPVTAGGGFTIQFTAKRRLEDAAPLVQRLGTLSDGGAWVVDILDSDTASFTKNEQLEFDVWMTEPDGTATVISRGLWKVRKSVGG